MLLTLKHTLMLYLRDKMAAVLQELRKAIEDHGIKAHFPVEVRFVKGDDIFLSLATGRKSKCFIGILMFR